MFNGSVITILTNKRYPGLSPELRKLSDKYPDLLFQCFDDFEDFKQSENWGKTDVLGLQARSLAELNESIQNNPIKWIHSFTAAVDVYVASDQLKQSGITFTNSKGVFNIGVAEYCLATMLYFTKNIQKLSEQKRDHLFNSFMMPCLHRSTLVILGYGSIGKDIAKRAKAFGMRIIGIKRRTIELDKYADLVVGIDKLHEVLPEVDFLVMALPNHPSTVNIIGVREFSLMKNTAVLINVGRGNSIDENALIDALTNKIIEGAALDVFRLEPLPENSLLWNTPNLIISPHNSCQTHGIYKVRVLNFEKYLNKFLEGSLNSNVDIQMGY